MKGILESSISLQTRKCWARNIHLYVEKDASFDPLRGIKDLVALQLVIIVVRSEKGSKRKALEIVIDERVKELKMPKAKQAKMELVILIFSEFKSRNPTAAFSEGSNTIKKVEAKTFWNILSRVFRDKRVKFNLNSLSSLLKN